MIAPAVPAGPDHVLVTARDEADRLPGTLAGLRSSFPAARLWVADDASRDATAELARAGGATVIGSGRRRGKGGAATLAARALLHGAGESDVVLLCDADLSASAGRLGPLADAVRSGQADLAVAAFMHRRGGGLGLAVAFARWAAMRRAGLRLQAPLSGQRALRVRTLATVLPFAARFGLELDMTIRLRRDGARVLELDLDLEHRTTGRSLRGFCHRGRQLADLVVVYAISARTLPWR